MKTDKKFDCVKMMRDIRDKVSSDIAEMSPDQIIKYIRKDSEKYDKLMARR
jgi:hypothetical protein